MTQKGRAKAAFSHSRRLCCSFRGLSASSNFCLKGCKYETQESKLFFIYFLLNVHCVHFWHIKRDRTWLWSSQSGLAFQISVKNNKQCFQKVVPVRNLGPPQPVGQSRPISALCSSLQGCPQGGGDGYRMLLQFAQGQSQPAGSWVF